MKLFKTLLTVAIAMALLAVPAGALAKSRDRDHDRMPDKWERKHHLNTHANDARKDPDKDHLSNLSEFRHHTDPRKADSDNDGIDDDDEVLNDTNPNRRDSDDDGVNDDDEISGTIVSFANNVLTIRLPGDNAGTFSGTVNAATEVECEDDDAPAATASHDGSDDNSGPGSDNSGPDSDDSGPGSDDDRQDDEQNDCTAADLKPGAHVHEAEFFTSGGTTVFSEVELVPAV
jgi:hypothetical protein